ncbi:MAG: hypothetical protein ACRYGR_07925 [Janthinobacterium lividum]
MRNHFEKFFLFDFIFFGLIMILYHYSDINDNFLKNLFNTTHSSQFMTPETVDSFKSWCSNPTWTPSSLVGILSFYGMTFLIGHITPTQLCLRTFVLASCAFISTIAFAPLSLSPYLFLLCGANLLLFLHWHQTYQSSSLRLCYLCLGFIVLDQGMVSLGWIFSIYILYLTATKTLKRRLKGLVDPIALILFSIVLLLWHQDIKTYASPYLTPFFPALGLLMSFKMDSIWHHRWIQKYRRWISSGLALSLPTGALLALYHNQGLPESIQPFFNNLSTSPYWVWLSLSSFGVFRCFRFQRSFWPEMTTAFQMIPLMLSGTQVMNHTQSLSFIQPFTQNILSQMTPSDPLAMSSRHHRLPRHLRKIMPAFTPRNNLEPEIILDDF